MKERIFLSYEHRDKRYADMLEKILSEEFEIMNFHLEFESLNSKKYKKKETIKASSTVIVLIGETTYNAKNLDEDLHHALANNIGIMGIKIPNASTSDDFIIPGRLADNVDSGYCLIYNWTLNIREIQNWVKKSIKKSEEVYPNNIRPLFGIMKKSLVTAIKSNDPCIFISHKNENKNKAYILRDYIKQLGINTFLDSDDKHLQENVESKNNKGIVEAIEMGVEKATALLCLISNVTKFSWWVPYELGLAKAHGKEMVAVILEKLEDALPEYLTILDSLSSEIEFESYMEDYINKNYSSQQYLPIIKNNKDLLKRVFT